MLLKSILITIFKKCRFMFTYLKIKFRINLAYSFILLREKETKAYSFMILKRKELTTIWDQETKSLDNGGMKQKKKKEKRESYSLLTTLSKA
jgi:hypothetical protein